jgi:hypothetical protein
MSVNDVELPPIGSRWIDTTGDDGVFTVQGHDKGCYVIASGQSLPDQVGYINWQHFGMRYQPLGEVSRG